MAPAATVASVGRTSVIAPSTAEADTAQRSDPPSRRRAIRPATATPRIAARKLGITADP